jgi:hypothetical protein
MLVFSIDIAVVTILGLLGEYCSKVEGKKECSNLTPDPQYTMAQYEET